MIKFENVSVRYGTGPEILQNLNFDLLPGSFHFLTGVSGAGKSSLLKLMYLAHLPHRGKITLFDKNIAHIPRDDLALLRRRIGVVFQEFQLLDNLTIFDNIALPLKISKVDDRIIKKNVTELLSWVGLADQAQAKPETLSGGQKQRAAIARAVIAQPQLLLADEPTGNVDDALAVRLLYLFEELNRQGTTVIIATHNEILIDQFSFPIMHLDAGKLTLQPARFKQANSSLLSPSPTVRWQR